MFIIHICEYNKSCWILHFKWVKRWYANDISIKLLRKKKSKKKYSTIQNGNHSSLVRTNIMENLLPGRCCFYCFICLKAVNLPKRTVALVLELYSSWISNVKLPKITKVLKDDTEFSNLQRLTPKPKLLAVRLTASHSIGVMHTTVRRAC